MADEALASFTSLLEHVPIWIADLEGVLRGAAVRQEEMLFDKQALVDTQPSSRPKTKSKSSSLRSRPSEQPSGEAKPAHHSILKRLTNSDALRLSQRKRKTLSACSGDYSGPAKVRAKAAIVVYYDGETQQHFERIVRTVGSSRNSIRKAKMSVKVASFARTGSSCSESSNNDDSEDDMNEFSPTSFRLSSKPTSTPRMPYRRDNGEVYDKVDSFLEKAQSSIEKAAHQVLREGDCTPEVHSAKDQFQQALQIIESELPLLQKQAAKAIQRRQRSQERRVADEDVHAGLRCASHLTTKMINVVPSPFPHESKLNVDALEVDDATDDDDDAGEFNLSTMRGNFGTFAGLRRTRLTAH